jgi:hypothetical protein
MLWPYRLLQKKDITGEETIIKVKDLAPASYYLQINDSQKELKTFKITKTN